MKKTWKSNDEQATKAYRELLRNCGIEAGDTVKVLRTFSDYEMGCPVSYGSFGSEHPVGSTYEVTRVDDLGVRSTLGYVAPFFVLEVVSKAVKPITVVLNSEHTAVVTKDGVKVGCQTFTLAKIDELMKAVAEVRKQP